MALKIKFSHNYPKLHRQTSGRLIAVELRNRADLHSKFVLYDTHYIDEYKMDSAVDGYYSLPKGLCLVLYFIGEYGIPFSTVRQATGTSETLYRTKIGQTFQVVLEPDNIKEGPSDLPGNTPGGNAPGGAENSGPVEGVG